MAEENGDRTAPAFRRTDRTDAPYYLARYTERRGLEQAAQAAGTAEEDENLPLYLRRFRARAGQSGHAALLEVDGDRFTPEYARTTREKEILPPPERKAQELAEQEQVDIRLHSIIYELQDEMKRAMSGLLEPVFKETYQGRAAVRETFRIPKVGTIAGCYVVDGLIKRDSEVRLLRDNVVVFKGKVGSLRRFKDDASEVRNGMECGIGIANYSDIKSGDVIEAFVVERVAAEAFA